MENLHIPITGDSSNFRSALQSARDGVRQTAKQIEDSGMTIEQVFDRIKNKAAGVFAGFSAAEFVRQVASVRSEIDKLETSFRILVGNKDKADALFSSIRKFAVETPMQLKDLAGAAQTMMGFGIATKDIMENLKAIGDVSMGDSQKFQSLALAFSQMSATGKLMGQDLLQMINAGFNPLDQMAKTTRKSVAELKEEMSRGAISADMVRQAFIDATSEGGKFNGMLEAQSKTLAGAYSNLQGAIGDMLNEIGEKSQGIMSGAMEVATDLVKNYETVGRVIMGLVVTYGVYKTAVMTVTALESFRTKNLALQAVGVQGVTAAEAVHYHWLVLTQKAQALLNATMLANPYVAVAVAIAAVTAAFISLGSEQDRVNAAYDEYMRKKDEAVRKEEEHKRKIDELIQTASDESLSTDTRRKALLKLEEKYPDIFKKYATEIEMLKHIRDIKAEIAMIDGQTSLSN
ncbi:MAG: tape measure protein, partial [Bacteroidaceae bacterium]|nr:tape measure protein [Bacteroidaceae bacterium]